MSAVILAGNNLKQRCQMCRAGAIPNTLCHSHRDLVKSWKWSNLTLERAPHSGDPELIFTSWIETEREKV